MSFSVPHLYAVFFPQPLTVTFILKFGIGVGVRVGEGVYI